jgi:hypothetical protein
VRWIRFNIGILGKYLKFCQHGSASRRRSAKPESVTRAQAQSTKLRKDERALSPMRQPQVSQTFGNAGMVAVERGGENYSAAQLMTRAAQSERHLRFSSKIRKIDDIPTKQ